MSGHSSILLHPSPAGFFFQSLSAILLCPIASCLPKCVVVALAAEVESALQLRGSAPMHGQLNAGTAKKVV